MDKQQEKAIRRVMGQATQAILNVLSVSPDYLPGADAPKADDLRITENITDALKNEGVTEADIEKAAKG